LEEEVAVVGGEAGANWDFGVAVGAPEAPGVGGVDVAKDERLRRLLQLRPSQHAAHPGDGLMTSSEDHPLFQGIESIGVGPVGCGRR